MCTFLHTRGSARRRAPGASPWPPYFAIPAIHFSILGLPFFHVGQTIFSFLGFHFLVRGVPFFVLEQHIFCVFGDRFLTCFARWSFLYMFPIIFLIFVEFEFRALLQFFRAARQNFWSAPYFFYNPPIHFLGLRCPIFCSGGVGFFNLATRPAP